MNIIFAGGFAFDIIDRLTTDETLGANGVDTADKAVNWIYDWFLWSLFQHPGLFFLCNIIWLVFVGWSLQTLMRYLATKAEGVVSIKRSVNRMVNKEMFMKYCDGKLDQIYAQNTVDNGGGGMAITQFVWNDPNKDRWGGAAMQMIIYLESKEGFLLHLGLTWNGTHTSALSPPFSLSLSLLLCAGKPGLI
jgi:hypothetical protein